MDSETCSVAEAHEAILCLRRLSEVFQQRRRQLAQTVGLTEHQWAVLEEITQEHFMPSMFARTRQSTPAAVSKTLRQLLDKGLVESSIAPTDGRQRRYVLTRRGTAALASLRKNRELAVSDIWLKMDAERVRAFTEFGTNLTHRLEQYAQEAHKE